ncbi:MAG: hypothetical protein GC136_04450 [Alphaproteobacteria bacterium]|nr:hypothetical protein [Alphaproteobacteria bacterium]
MRFLLVLLALLPLPAFADYNVWQDARTGVSLSYPDTWKQINNKLPYGVITLAARTNGEPVECALMAEKDARWAMYPAHLRDSVQKFAYNTSVWPKYFGGRPALKIVRTYEPAGLGRGWGTAAIAAYAEHDAAGVPHYRSSLVVMALYNKTAYTADCSAPLGEFERWEPVFRAFMKSIDHKKEVHELTIGEYVDFLKPEGSVEFPDLERMTTKRY